jgi:hypothetical protein
MESDSLVSTFHVHLDTKRRPTLPARLLADAGLTGASELVAWADGLGRIVLEDPGAMLTALQDRLVGALEGTGATGESVVDSLLADRAADNSLNS